MVLRNHSVIGFMNSSSFEQPDVVICSAVIVLDVKKGYNVVFVFRQFALDL